LADARTPRKFQPHGPPANRNRVPPTVFSGRPDPVCLPAPQRAAGPRALRICRCGFVAIQRVEIPLPEDQSRGAGGPDGLRRHPVGLGNRSQPRCLQHLHCQPAPDSHSLLGGSLWGGRPGTPRLFEAKKSSMKEPGNLSVAAVEPVPICGARFDQPQNFPGTTNSRIRATFGKGYCYAGTGYRFRVDDNGSYPVSPGGPDDMAECGRQSNVRTVIEFRIRAQNRAQHRPLHECPRWSGQARISPTGWSSPWRPPVPLAKRLVGSTPRPWNTLPEIVRPSRVSLHRKISALDRVRRRPAPNGHEVQVPTISSFAAARHAIRPAETATAVLSNNRFVQTPPRSPAANPRDAGRKGLGSVFDVAEFPEPGWPGTGPVRTRWV